MENKRYLNALTLIFVIALAGSMALFSKVNYSMQNTNLKTDYQYAGSTDQMTLENYYASTGEYYGGATLNLEEAVDVASVEIKLENDTILTHPLIQLDELSYVLQPINVKEFNIKPTEALIKNSLGEEVDVISLKAEEGDLYSYNDENQAWRHIYLNDAGIFLGEYTIEDLSEDIKPNVVLEICTKDETKSQGYHLLAKKQLSLGSFTNGKDLGFVAYTNQTQYDGVSDLYVIIHWSDTNIQEIPLVKGAK